jgi:nickel-type superoxide dismutase maturation protease
MNAPMTFLFRNIRQRFRVVDWSMAPTYVPGDRLFTVPLPQLGRPLRDGDLVVLWDPEHPRRRLLKRVIKITPAAGDSPAQVEVQGDNLLRSRDSRHFGPVPVSQVIGIVVDSHPR